VGGASPNVRSDADQATVREVEMHFDHVGMHFDTREAFSAQKTIARVTARQLNPEMHFLAVVRGKAQWKQN
jgi:hypothetical protein